MRQGGWRACARCATLARQPSQARGAAIGYARAARDDGGLSVMTLLSDPVTCRTTLSIAASPRLSSLLRTARRASPVGLLATASHGGSSARRHVAMAALGYVAAIGVAELVTTLGDPRAGVLIHTVILSALILHASFVAR